MRDLQSRCWMKFYGCTAHQDCGQGKMTIGYEK